MIILYPSINVEVTCYYRKTMQPIIAQVFIRVIKRALCIHYKPLLVENQHNFIKGQILYFKFTVLHRHLTICLNKHTIYTDFCKAFVMVPHHLLVHKSNTVYSGTDY